MKLIFIILLISTLSFAKSPEKVKLEEIDEKQSKNFKELGGSAVLTSTSLLYMRQNNNQINALSNTIHNKLEEQRMHVHELKQKDTKYAKAPKEKKHTVLKEYKTAKSRLDTTNSTQTGNENKLKRLKVYQKANIGLLTFSAIASIKNLIDSFTIGAEMRELIDCNPELLHQAAPIKESQTINVVDVLKTVKKAN